MFRNLLGAALFATTALVAGPALASPGGGHGGGPGMGSHGGMPSGAMGGSFGNPMNARISRQTFVHASPSSRSSTRIPARRTPVRFRSSRSLAMHNRANLAARANSQGLMHASFRAIERANSRSALARGAVQASALPGLHDGLTVKSSGGATIGTVNRIVTGSDGKIRLVVATSSTGRTIRLAPNLLSISGGVVTTKML